MRARTLAIGLTAIVLLPVAAIAEELFDYTYFDVTYTNNGIDNVSTMIDGNDIIGLEIDEGAGYGARASLALTPGVHVFGAYSKSDLGLNAVHRVAMPTLGAMQDAFYATPEARNWDAPCDLNGDGAINSVDLGILRAAGDMPRTVEEVSVNGDLTDWKVGVGVNRLLTERVSGYAQIFWADRDVSFDRALFAGETRDASADGTGVGATLGARGKVTDRLELNGNVTYTPVGDIDLLADAYGDRVRNDTVFGLGGQFWITDSFSVLAGAEGDGDVRAWTLGVRVDLGERAY